MKTFAEIPLEIFEILFTSLRTIILNTISGGWSQCERKLSERIHACNTCGGYGRELNCSCTSAYRGEKGKFILYKRDTRTVQVFQLNATAVAVLTK